MKKARKRVSFLFVLAILFSITGSTSMADTLLPNELTHTGEFTNTGELTLSDEMVILDEDPITQAAGSFKALTNAKDGVSSSIFRMADWEAIKGKTFAKGVMLDGFTSQNVNLCTFGIEYNVLKAIEFAKIKKVTLMTDSGVVTFPPNAFTGIMTDFLAGKAAEVADTAILNFDMKRITALEAFPLGISEKQKSACKAGNPVHSDALRTAVTDGGKEIVQTVPLPARFDKQVVVSWPYLPKAGENRDKLTAWCLSNDGSIDNAGGRYNAQSGLFQALVSHFGFHTVASVPVSYKDVNTHWATGVIHRLSAMGIISGNDGNFRPNAQLTRAEFAKMIVLAKKMSMTDETSKFTDVEAGDWYNTYVAAAVVGGFINGNADDTFAPFRFITRQDMAVMMQNALVDDNPVVDFNPLVFEDEAKIADYAYDSVVIVSELGIMNGKSGIAKDPMALVFDPDGFVTRGEAAAVVYRFLDYLLGE